MIALPKRLRLPWPGLLAFLAILGLTGGLYLKAREAEIANTRLDFEQAAALRINALRSASTHIKPEADRIKKLLMHREQIRRLIGKTEQKGYTIVPLNLHWKGGRVKADIALAKGKAEHDKRNTIKDRDWEREKGRLMRHKVSSSPKD